MSFSYNEDDEIKIEFGQRYIPNREVFPDRREVYHSFKNLMMACGRDLEAAAKKYEDDCRLSAREYKYKPFTKYTHEFYKLRNP